MAVFENYAPAVIQALQTRGLTGECPLCKKNQWVVHEVPVSIPVYESAGNVQFPGTSMPMAAMICRNCGWSGFFSLGALGLINPQGNQAASQPATPPLEPLRLPDEPLASPKP
jgi:hypothetical protein